MTLRAHALPVWECAYAQGKNPVRKLYEIPARYPVASQPVDSTKPFAGTNAAFGNNAVPGAADRLSFRRTTTRRRK